MHDLVIRGGTVIDGTGALPRRADVAIDGDRVVAVGSVTPKRSAWADALTDCRRPCSPTEHSR